MNAIPQIETLKRIHDEIGLIEVDVISLTHEGIVSGEKRMCVNSIELIRQLMALDSAQRAREGQEPG